MDINIMLHVLIIEYSFSHQVWRDYFSAVYLANSIDYDVAGEFEYQISDNIQQYAGEIIKEYKFENKTDVLSPMSPIEAFMQRNCNTLSPLAVRLCIEIMQKSRNGNLTAKYNHLDLRSINFYDYNLKGSSFDSTKVYEYNFIPQGHTDIVTSVCYSPDGKRIVSGSKDGTIRIWNVEIGMQIGEPFEGHTDIVKCVSYSPDGTRIVSGGGDGTIRIWDAETGKQIGKALTSHTDIFISLCYSPNGKRIVSGSSDGTIRIWNAETGKQIGEALDGHTSSVQAVSYSPDGKRIVSSSFDRTIRIWDAETGKQIGEPIDGHTGVVNTVCYSPNGKRIVSGDWVGTIRIWDAETGKQIGEPIDGHTNWVNTVCCSPDGKRIVSGSSDGTIRIWNAETGKQIGEALDGHTSSVQAVSYSPDGKRIVSSGWDRTIRIWDAETGKQIGVSLSGHKDEISSVSYSLNENELRSSNFDGEIRIWNVETGQWIRKSQGKCGMIGELSSYLSDGKRQAIVSDDFKEILIWNLEKGIQIEGLLNGHTKRINSITYSPDGKQIASGSNDETIRIWDLETHLCTILKGIIQSNIQKCDFKNAIFNSEDINDFCHILYCNGADVPKEYEPKPIPFEWNDEELSDKESE